jgi:hypothetical protein
MAPHPAQQWKRLAFEWVARSNDGDRGRIALEVGSVMPFRSTKSRTPPCCNEYEFESEINACWRW